MEPWLSNSGNIANLSKPDTTLRTTPRRGSRPGWSLWWRGRSSTRDTSSRRPPVIKLVNSSFECNFYVRQSWCFSYGLVYSYFLSLWNTFVMMMISITKLWFCPSHIVSIASHYNRLSTMIHMPSVQRIKKPFSWKF